METLNLKSLSLSVRGTLENLLTDATVKRSINNAAVRKEILKPFRKIEKAVLAELNNEHTTSAVTNEAKRIADTVGMTAQEIREMEITETEITGTK